MAKGWGDTKPNSGQIKWQELLDWYKCQPVKKMEFNNIRLIGPIMSACYHWVEVQKQDGNKVNFPMTCSGYNPETEETEENKCPACRAKINQQKFYFQNSIIRQLQEDKPARAKSITDFPAEVKKKYREVGDESWSPIKVIRITTTCATQLRDIVKLNRHKIGGNVVAKDVSDNKYGVDIFIKYDPDQSPASMYNVQKGDPTPLSEEELKYKLFNLEVVKTDPIKAEKDLIRLGHLKRSQAIFSKIEEEDETDIPEEDDDMDNVPEDSEFQEEELEPEDMFDEMDRTELKRYIFKNKLAVKVTTKMTDDNIRTAIRSTEPQEPQDPLKALDRTGLKRLIKKDGLEVRVTTKMTDDDIRAAINKVSTSTSTSATGGNTPTTPITPKECYGSYEAASKCFECSIRTKCIEKADENEGLE